jgi:DNA sulfur modification protein DndB
VKPPVQEEFDFVLPAVRGIQAGREFYVVMCPLKVLSRLFHLPATGLAPHLRAQRALNKGRIPQLVRYVSENRQSYVFSSLAASVDGEVKFVPASDNGKLKGAGVLSIPVDARLLVNDGQHRLEALQRALSEHPELSNENISIVIYADAGLQRSQQMFADLNRYAIKPTRSLNILYDHRDPMAELARALTDSVPVFSGMTEMAANTISNRERKLFTLNAIYHATQHLLGRRTREPVTAKEAESARAFWIEVSCHMKDWLDAAAGKKHPFEMRKTRVHAHGIALQAIAIAGNSLMTEDRRHWKRRLAGLADIDWSRSNTDLWEGRAMSGGKICKAGNHLKLTANIVKRALGVTLSPSDTSVEQAHEPTRPEQLHRSEKDHTDAKEPQRSAPNGRGAVSRRRKAVGNRV